jgi:hypothetical protein
MSISSNNGVVAEDLNETTYGKILFLGVKTLMVIEVLTGWG